MTDTVFPTGFTHLTSVTTAFTLLADSGTTNGWVTIGDVVGLVPVATSSTPGLVQPDNTTITISGGVLTAVGGGGGGSGSVGAGTTNQLAYYAGSGTTVSALNLNTAFQISGGSLAPVFGTTSTTFAQGNHTHSIYAPIASPTFTGVVALPTWTTGTRPAGTPAASQIGYATDTNRFEGYNGTSWLSFLRGSDIPAASGQLLGGSGTAGTASGVTVSTGLSLSGGVLTATGVASFTRSTITASGALTVPTTGITEYLVDSSSPLALTLAVPTVDVEVLVKRKDKLGGAHTLTLNADGTAGTVYTFNSPEGGDGLQLRGNAARGTWEVVNINDPGFLFSDLSSIPTNPTNTDLLSIERAGTPYRLNGNYYAPSDSPTFTTKIVLPSWTTAGRPSSPVAGTEGWNTDLSRRDTYNGSTWNQHVRISDMVATSSQLFGGTGSNGVATAISLGANLSISGGTLNATTGSATAGGTNGQYQINSGGALAGVTFSGDLTATTGGVVTLANTSTARANLGLSAVAFGVDFSQGAVVANGTITVSRKAPFALTINSLDYEVGSAGGSFTVAVKIAGTNVTGLSAVAVSSSTSANAAASAANSVSAGQAITIVISSVSGSPTGANLQINGTR
jgi:hypothetical protein